MAGCLADVVNAEVERDQNHFIVSPATPDFRTALMYRDRNKVPLGIGNLVLNDFGHVEGSGRPGLKMNWKGIVAAGEKQFEYEILGFVSGAP
jgi:hypothetical protein